MPFHIVQEGSDALVIAINVTGVAATTDGARPSRWRPAVHTVICEDPSDAIDRAVRNMVFITNTGDKSCRFNDRYPARRGVG
jgi:hypothetical protein